MAQKDIAERALESYDNVFADIVNVLLFDGDELVKPDELEDQAARTAYKAEDKLREIERDVVKRWRKQSIRLACIGVENQTLVDPDMPLRVMGYDGTEYRSELNGKDRYPVATLVLYFGYSKRWDKPKNLCGCFNIPERFRPYVKDYEMNLFEIAYLDDEQVKMFKSDFKIVADYFVQMRKSRNYIPTTEEIEHVQEVLQMMSILTGDYRFEEAYEKELKGDAKNMCEFLDRIINEGKAEGIAVGKAEGIAVGKAEGKAECAVEMLMKYMKKHKCGAEEAMDEFEITPSERIVLRPLLF